MKKRMFSIFLILALLLTALAGCGKDNDASSRSSGDDGGEEETQLLDRGYYEIRDEDDELAGYLHVTSSKIIIYDEVANEGDTLRYDYNAKKDLYTLDSGELFGSDEFTVKESGKALTLITDDGEYTLTAIDKEDMPKPGTAKTPGFDDPADVELPLGCYAAYNGSALVGYMKVTDRTITSYGSDGDIGTELRYSYDPDGGCIVDLDGDTFTYHFTLAQGSYYMSYGGESARLEPIQESDIPAYTGGDGPSAPTPDVYYIGGNGSIGLSAYLPEEMYGELVGDQADGSFTAVAQYYDSNAGTALIFSAVLSSDDNLRDALAAAREDTDGNYVADDELLYSYLRDNFLLGGLDSGYISLVYVGDDLDYDVYEDDMTLDGRLWRYCDIFINAGDGAAYISMMFWMEGEDMALVIVGGVVEDPENSGSMYDEVCEIIFSLKLDT